jgi:hypothetical protein
LAVVPKELFRVNIPCNAKHGGQLQAKYLTTTRMTGTCFKDRVINIHGWVNVKWSNGQMGKSLGFEETGCRTLLMLLVWTGEGTNLTG